MAIMQLLFKNRTLLILGLTESISGIGDWITMMAVLAMLVFRSDGGLFESSGIFMAGLLPSLVSSPAAGWLVDRMNRKFLMIGSQILAGLVVSLLLFVDRVEMIYAVLAIEAVHLSIMAPARQSIIPDIVSREDLQRANALLQQLASLVKVFSPIIAGLVLSVLDPHQAIIFDVLSFFVTAGILFFLPAFIPRPSNTLISQNEVKNKPITQIFRQIPQLRVLFIAVFVAILAIIGFDVISSVYFRDILQQSEREYGFAIGLVGIGSLGAGLVILMRKKPSNPWVDLVYGYLLLALIPVSIWATSSFKSIEIAQFVVLAACLVGGVGNGFIHVQVGTLLQLLAPPNILGQISGWMQLVMIASQVIGLVFVPLLVPRHLTIPAYFGWTVLLFGILILFLCVQVFGKNRMDSNLISEETIVSD